MRSEFVTRAFDSEMASVLRSDRCERVCHDWTMTKPADLSTLTDEQLNERLGELSTLLSQVIHEAYDRNIYPSTKHPLFEDVERMLQELGAEYQSRGL